jgi:hypothetical protein
MYSFQNVVSFKIPDNGLSPKTHLSQVLYAVVRTVYNLPFDPDYRRILVVRFTLRPLYLQEIIFKECIIHIYAQFIVQEIASAITFIGFGLGPRESLDAAARRIVSARAGNRAPIV